MGIGGSWRPSVALLTLVLVSAACTSGVPKATGPDQNQLAEFPSVPSSPPTVAADPIPEPGSLVTRLQEDLTHLGLLTGPLSTDYDDRTATAIELFERSVGLPMDGLYDLQVAALLDLARGRARGAATWALQSALRGLGYYRDPLNGADTAALEDAIRGFQAAAGLTPTGRYEERTAAALYSRIRKEQPIDWVFGPQLQVPTPPVVEPDSESRLPPLRVVQERLASLGYRPGPPDGEEGPGTTAAIIAFQKREGIRVDGVVGPETALRLETPQGAGPRPGLPVPRIEIDLERQIAFVVLDDGSVTTLPVSTGNGMRYTTEAGGTAVGRTPTGMFTVRRVIDGVREAPLGTLYRPLYFHRGWAIHGSNSVPAYPASHGCVRVNRWDQDWLFPRVGIGTSIVIYGGDDALPADAAAGA